MYMVDAVGEPEKESPQPEKKGGRGAYDDFVVLFYRGDGTHIEPSHGLEQTLSYVKEKLSEGYTVQIRPYTQDEWAEKMKQKVEF